MAVPAQKLLDIDSFLDFAAREEGEWELVDGQPVAVAPERVRHTVVKGRVYIALDRAVREAKLRCEALTEGLTIRIRHNRAFRPDALVVCLPPPPEVVIIDDPIIVAEVLSPSTEGLDHGIKLEGYFSLPSLTHYLILDPDRRVVIHHKRGVGDVIETRIVNAGALSLSPPGIEVQVDDLFGRADEPEA